MSSSANSLATAAQQRLPQVVVGRGDAAAGGPAVGLGAAALSAAGVPCRSFWWHQSNGVSVSTKQGVYYSYLNNGQGVGKTISKRNREVCVCVFAWGGGGGGLGLHSLTLHCRGTWYVVLVNCGTNSGLIAEHLRPCSLQPSSVLASTQQRNNA